MGKQLNITFKNTVDPDLVLGSGSDFGIIELEGFDASCVDVQSEEYQFDGGYISTNRLGSRTLSIVFDYQGASENIQDSVYRFFTHEKPGKLIITVQGLSRAIGYTIESLKRTDKSMYVYPKFEVSLVCPSGYFEDPDYNTVSLESWENGWTHRWSGRFHLRQRGKGVVDITNDGHLFAPVRVEFEGPADQPKVLNLTTNTEFGVKTTLAANESLEIITDEVLPLIWIANNTDDTKKNGYPYVTIQSDFSFGLKPGINRIRYAQKNADLLNRVTLKFKRRYMGAY